MVHFLERYIAGGRSQQHGRQENEAAAQRSLGYAGTENQTCQQETVDKDPVSGYGASQLVPAIYGLCEERYQQRIAYAEDVCSAPLPMG